MPLLHSEISIGLREHETSLRQDWDRASGSGRTGYPSDRLEDSSDSGIITDSEQGDMEQRSGQQDGTLWLNPDTLVSSVHKQTEESIACSHSCFAWTERRRIPESDRSNSWLTNPITRTTELVRFQYRKSSYSPPVNCFRSFWSKDSGVAPGSCRTLSFPYRTFSFLPVSLTDAGQRQDSTREGHELTFAAPI